jgi:hypothetical protein
MNIQSINQWLDEIEERTALIRTEVNAPPPDLFVPAGGNLQEALDGTAATIRLEQGQYGYAVIRRPVTLRGAGATLIGAGCPALRVVPGVSDVEVFDIVCQAENWRGGVVQLGDNSATTQGALDQVPIRITLENVRIPTHRGKAGFEIHSTETTLQDCSALDVWDPGLSDSKAIWIHNTPGWIAVRGGNFSSGSECIMVGGDTTRIPGNTPSDILFEGLILFKPEEWRTDGIKRAVKNLFELKAGRRVTMRNSMLSGSWTDAQIGFAILLTPRNLQVVEDVTFDNITVERAAGGINFMGLDVNLPGPTPTRRVTIRNSKFTVSKSYVGRGILAQYVDGMQDSAWENVAASFDGNCIVLCDSKTPTGPFEMRNSAMPTGQYAVLAPGVNFGGPTPPAYAGRAFTTVFEGNTFSGAPSQFKGFYPNNTFVV